MADGRKIQYLIELLPDTKQFEKIRNKMKAIDGGEFIKFEPSEVKKLKGILQGVVDDVGNRASSIGAKIQDGIAKGINKASLEKMLDIDTSKLRETMEIVEKLTGLIDDHSKGNSWLKDGKGFLGKLSGSQQDLKNLEQSIGQLELKFEGLDTSLTNTIAKFETLATAIKTLQGNGKPVTVSPINITTGTKQVQQFEKEISDLNTLLNNISDKEIKINTDNIPKKFHQIAKEADKLSETIDNLIDDADAPGLSKDVERNLMMQIAQKKEQLAQMYREMDALNKQYQKTRPGTTLSLFDDEGVIDNPKDIIKQAKEYIESFIKELSATTKSTTAQSGNAIGLEIALPSADDIKQKLNSVIDQLNKPNALHRVKLEVDDSIVPIEGRLDKTLAAVKKKLTGDGGILGETKKWRTQMLEQFKFKSGDFEFNFNNTLIEELQSIFDEYGLKINIDPTYLADQIKTVLDGSNVSLSGGTASIDQESMMKAVMAGVRAAFFGEALPATNTSSSQEKIPDATEQVVAEIEQTAKHLDLADEYVQDVVNKVKDVAKYATKHIGTDKDSAGAKETRKRFKMFGIDLESVLGATDDTQIAAMLEQSLLQRGDFNKLIGSTVIDELSTFKGSSSKTISAFVDSLREMFYMIQEDTETVDEWTRKKHSREIFDDAQKHARAASSLRDVRSPIRAGKIPDIEYIDKAIATMSAIGKNTDSLTALKLAREELGDKTDEQSIQKFNNVANDFYKSTTKVFYNIKRYAEDAFNGTVYLQGSKKGVVKKQKIESYKQLARVGDDEVILDIKVTSSSNNVVLDTDDRMSKYQEKRLLDGKRGDYIVSPEYEKDILNRELEYGGFKPQGISTTNVDLTATLDANTKKRESLMAEIKANEEEKKLLREQIDAADKQIANLTAKNNEVPQGRRDAALRKIADYETKKAELTNDIFWLEEQVGNGKDGAEKRIGNLTTQIEEQLSKRSVAEKHLAELSELDVERRKKSFTNKIAEIEKDDLPKLQEELNKAQVRYSTANSEKILAQVEVNKANSALKKIPNNKANAEARAEAETRVNRANSELARATEKFEETSRDVDSITNQIESSKRNIENLKGQISETTLETIRQEQIARIEAINNVITSLENTFEETLKEKKSKETKLKRTNTTLDRARNDPALMVQKELNETVSAREALIARDGAIDKSNQTKQDEVYRLELLNQRVKAEQEYNTLQEKSMVLQGSIKKMEEDGATEDALSSKRAELEKINVTLADALEKVQKLGGFLAQRDTREYTDAERKTYALEQIKQIDNDLITARAQKNVVASRIAKKDREIAEVDRWGLGAGIGARTLNQEKYKVTSEFMNSDYVRSLIDTAREQTKNAIEEAVGKSAFAETEALRAFNEKVANAMIKDGLNPHSAEQTQAFLRTTRGEQYSEDYNTEITSIQNSLQESTRELWSAYDERVKSIRSQVSAEFKESMKVDNGVLNYISKIRDESGEWVNELVKVHVRDALRTQLVNAKEILEEEQAPMQSNIDRLYADRKTAIAYGGVGKKEILSANVIEDQILKQTELDKLLDKRIDKEKDLKDLEMAGVQDSDDSVKRVNREIESLNKQIAQYEMLIRNRQKLVELRWDESKADSYTNEEKELHFTEQVVSYNQKIEDSLAKQEELKQKIANASGEEKTKLQYQLSKEEEKVTKWRQSVSTTESKLQNIDTAKSVTVTRDTSTASIASLMKETLGDTNINLTPVTEILNKILEVLNTFKTDGIKKSDTDASKKGTDEKKSEQDAKKLDLKQVEVFSEKFKNAVQIGYLSDDDAIYKAFKNKVEKIQTLKTAKAKERARNDALQIADEVTKRISQNKKLYTGTTEMNAASRQYEHLESSGILDQADVEMVEKYKAKYDEIAKIQAEWRAKDKGKGLLNPEAQKQLRDAAIEAKKLGKELEKATTNSQRLEQLMNDSGEYLGQSIGQRFKLEDDTGIYDQMIAKLKELGAEHIKVDRVRRTATGTIRHNSKTVSDLTVEYDKLHTSLVRYQKQERESLTGLPAFLNGFQKKFNSIMQYLTMTMSIHQVISQVRRGVQYVKEIDLALTELRKVTDETEETYDRFLQTAAKTGERLGSTISAVTEATATFAKLGYSMQQATEMAESAIVYKNVGDNIASTEDAADSIISTMKGFGLEASESMAIVDKFNEVKFLPPYTAMYMTKMAISEKF